MRAPVSTELFCTDASGGCRPGVAGVHARVPSEVANQLWRFRARRGGYVRVETDAQAAARRLEHLFDDPEVLDDSDDTSSPSDIRWLGGVCDALGWKPEYAYQPQGRSHQRPRESRH